MVRFITALAALIALASTVHAQGPAIDDLARRTMKQWKMPGLALVIVRDDRLVYLKGFGLRELGKSHPVTADTVFPIASCTKSFTTLAMGMLVDDDKLDWDDSVRKHVPFFRLADPLADAAVTLRDLVTHRTGIGSHDLLWYGTPWNLEERIRMVCKLDPERSFREGFRYQVVLFGAAGLAVGTASGGSWEDFVQKRILNPLEMKSSRCTFTAELARGELASPHRTGPDGKNAVIPRYSLVDPDPAGSIHSTARDLANYLRFQLGDGTWQGKRLISTESLGEPHAPQIVLPRRGMAKTMNPESQFLHYGMGWVVQDYRGRMMVMHGGSIDGFRSHLTLVPELRLGIGVLSNLDGGIANLGLSNSIVDLFLGTPTRDWSGLYLDIYEQGERDEAARAKAMRDKRGPDKGPPRPLASYAGVYHDAAYGACKIEVDKQDLVWTWGNVRCILEHYEGDIYLASTTQIVDAPFIFTAEKDGTIGSFKALDRVFRRKQT